MHRLNSEALLKLTHHFAQCFAAPKSGGIVLLSSLVGFQGGSFAAHYVATKACVQSFAEGLAVELKPYNVLVFAVAPRPVRTSFEAKANINMNVALNPNQISTPTLEALGKKRQYCQGVLQYC